MGEEVIVKFNDTVLPMVLVVKDELKVTVVPETDVTVVPEATPVPVTELPVTIVAASVDETVTVVEEATVAETVVVDAWTYVGDADGFTVGVVGDSVGDLVGALLGLALGLGVGLSAA